MKCLRCGEEHAPDYYLAGFDDTSYLCLTCYAELYGDYPTQMAPPKPVYFTSGPSNCEMCGTIIMDRPSIMTEAGPLCKDCHEEVTRNNPEYFSTKVQEKQQSTRRKFNL